MRRWLGFLAITTVVFQKLSVFLQPLVVFCILIAIAFYNLGIFNRIPDWHLTILSGTNSQHRHASIQEALRKGYYQLASTLAQGDMELTQLSKTPDQLHTELRWWESLYSLQPNAQPVLRSLSIIQKAYGNTDRANELMQKSDWLRPTPNTDTRD